MENIAPLDELTKINAPRDDVFFAPGAAKLARILGRARSSGVDVILDGHGGDEVASHGFGRLTELARDRSWFTLYRELRGVSTLYGASPLAMFANYFFSQGVALRLRQRLTRLRGASAAETTAGSIVSRDFAVASNLPERFAAWRSAYRQAAKDERSLHMWNVSSPMAARSFEALARIADHAHVDLRFPFYDRRLVSYALAVPEAEKLRDGWTRSVLRRAMAGTLPEKVRWRRTKINFGFELAEGLARHHKGLFGSVLRNDAPIAAYVDVNATRALAARLFANPSDVAANEVFALWRVGFLGIWLESRQVRHRERELT